MRNKMLTERICDGINGKKPTTPRPKVIPRSKDDECNEYLVSYHYDNKIAKGIGENGFKGKGKITYDDIAEVRKEVNEALKQKLNTEVDFNIVILNIINLSKL